jgi:trimeric autotransporter adhesin
MRAFRSRFGSGFLRGVTRRRLVGRTQGTIAMIAATALLLGAIGAISGSSAFGNSGDGTMSVSPTFVAAGSTTNVLVFTFASTSTYGSGSYLTLQIPAGWTQPVATANVAGSVTVSAGTCSIASLASISTGSGPWTITVNQQCISGKTMSITYGAGTSATHVVAPATAAADVLFQAKSHSGSGGTPQNLDSSPTVDVIGSASQVVFTTDPAGTIAVNVPITTQPVVKVEDSAGNVITGSTAPITLAINTGPGTTGFTCTTNPLNAVAGVATFGGCKIGGLAGAYTLSAASPSLTGDTSGSFTITAGTAAQLAFSPSPGGGASGSVWTTQPTVQVQDGFGNLVNSSASILLGIGTNPGATSFTCTTNPKNASTGNDAFGGCKIVGTAGSYTLTATSGTLTAAVSNPFTIGAGPASQLVFTTQPSVNANIAAGSSTNVGVSVEDANNNVETTDNTTTVTLSLAPNPAPSTLSCTNPGGTTATVSAGVASFSCSLNKVATGYKFSALSSPTHGTVVSNAFNVVVGPAAKLVITSTAITSSASANAANQATVSLEDAAGNVTSIGSATTVNLSSSSAGAKFAASNGGAAVTSVVLLASTSSVAFFYGDTVAGTPTITVNASAFSPDSTQAETINPAAANKLAFVQQPTSALLGDAISPAVTVQVQDQFGNSVSASGVSVTLTGSSGATSTNSPVSTGSAGLATFSNITTSVPDTGLTLSASAPSLAGSGPSNAFTVSVPVANGAALTASVSDAGTGVSSVTYYYCSGGFTGACSSANGTSIGSSSTAAGNYPVTWNNQPANGAYRLVTVAVDKITNTSTSSSMPVTIGNVDHFVVSAPASTAVGASFSVTVSAVDGSNSVLAGYSRTIHFASSDGAAVLPANYTFADADNGTHTFTGVVLNTTGTKSITVNDTVATSKTGSTNVTVTAGAPGAPANVTVTNDTCVISLCTVQVNFSAPASNGGATITQYNASCSSSNGGGAPTPKSGASSPIQEPGFLVGPNYLAQGKLYTCSVTATNSVGTGPAGTSVQFTA